VYYEIGSSTTKNLAGTVTGTSYTHTGLTASTAYYYYIKAVNDAGESGYSSSGSATTSSGGGGGGGGSAPNAPSTFTATVSGANVNLSWSSVSGATSYKIAVLGTDGGVLKTDATGTSWTHTSALPGTRIYQIAAVNSYGQSSAKTSNTVTVPLATPSIASSGGISYGTASQTLEILINPVAHATEYYVYHSTSASGTYTVLGAVASTITLGSYVNFEWNIPRGSGTFYFKVEARYDGGTVRSAQSAYKSFTIPN
jgi:predicted phage tail protein